ncbi:MAG: sialidase family protein [Gemmatimonadaceae bacterium]
MRRVALMGLVAIAAIGAASTRTFAPIDSPAGPGSAEPNLAVAPNGDVYLSWLEPIDSGHALRFSRHDGKQWTPARTIRSGRDFFVNWADFPSLEVLGDNRLAAHWLQRSGTGTYAYHVKIAFSGDGGATWSEPMRPHTDTSNTEHGFVTLWREGNDLGVAWLDGRRYDKEGHHASNEMMVLSTTIGRGGRRGAEVPLDARACDCCQTSAAMTAEGPIVAYRDRSPDEIRDISVVRRVGGEWTAPRAVHADNWQINACPVNGPAVDARARDIAVAWFTAANSSAQVKVAFSSDAGATFGPPVRLDGGAPAGRVDLVLLPDGSALVSWIERVGGDTAAVQARRVMPNGKAGAPMTIASSSAARASGFPRMALTSDAVMFAWTQPGRPSAVKLARFPISTLK